MSPRPATTMFIWDDISMPSPQTLSTVLSSALGVLCIASALPFVGIPFPTQSWADYYEAKNQWNSELSGGRLTLKQAGYLGAAVRIVVGAGCIYPPTREVVLVLNGLVVIRGTMLAWRDGRPMWPQWGMLSAVVVCLVLGRL
ncbi:hypothetical protein B0H13DRAFT_290776, partial [Mycena leptocephala]